MRLHITPFPAYLILPQQYFSAHADDLNVSPTGTDEESSRLSRLTHPDGPYFIARHPPPFVVTDAINKGFADRRSLAVPMMDDQHVAASNKRLRACTNCTTAKTKCTPYSNLNNLCERCQRLGKSCIYADAVVRPKKHRVSSRKQLEDKVDSLVNILSTIQSGQKPQNEISNSVPAASPTQRLGVPSSNLTSPTDSGLDLPSVENPKRPDGEMSELLDALPLEMANELFSQYCTDIAPGYPFVTFGPSETVSTMRINRPLTLKSLLSVAMYRDANTQNKACAEITTILKKLMMSRSTYSFDLLQAILIQTAFYHYQFRPTSQQLMLMVQFAAILTHELGIDKSPIDKRAGMTIQSLRTTSTQGVRYEQWRALLGAYYAAAAYTQAFRKPRLMQYTKFMERCRQRLLESMELQTDHTLDLLIGVMNVCLEVNDTFTLYDVESPAISGDLPIKALVTGYLDKVLVLEERAQHRRNGTLSSNERRLLLYARTYLHEVAVHKEFWPVGDPSNPSISPTRTELGWTGLSLAKKLLSEYAHLPAQDFFKFDTAPNTQMLYSLLMLNKFIALDSTDDTTAPTTEGSLPPTRKAQSRAPGPAQWDTRLAAEEAEITRLGGMLLANLTSLVTEEKLYDGSRPIMLSFAWLARNMIEGHRLWISSCCRDSSPSCDAEYEAPPTAPGTAIHEPASLNGMSIPALRFPNPISNTSAMPSAQPPPRLASHRPPPPPSSTTDHVPNGFFTVFPNVSLDATLDWGNGAFQTHIWDTMMNDMTTLPFS